MGASFCQACDELDGHADRFALIGAKNSLLGALMKNFGYFPNEKSARSRERFGL